MRGFDPIPVATHPAIKERCLREASVITRHDCFTHWWACLPAIPPSRTALDFWAVQDGRCSRYERLKRVWFDTTRLLAPKDDPDRPHEFGKLCHGTSLTCKTWENFSLFGPGEWIRPLLSIAGFDLDFHAVDRAWSYEFEAMIGNTQRFKLADVTMHARNAAGTDLLIVVEVKRPGDKLKEDCDPPDTQPGGYLDREAFQSIPLRRLLYLVDEAYAPFVSQKVTPNDARWGIVTWRQFFELQQSLAASLSQPLGAFVAATIACAFRGASFSGLSHQWRFRQ